MENEQYLYFVVAKEQLEQVATKRKSTLNTDVYTIKVKKIHSCWRDLEFKFSTEIFAESQSYVLLRSTIKWHDHNIKSLTISNCFCEIHYGSDSFVLTAYYTDKNLKDAFKDYGDLKILDDHEVKKYLYFVVRKSVLEKLNYIAENGHLIYLRVGENNEIEIGCKIINVNKEYDPYVMIRSIDNFQHNSIYLRKVIESLKNDDTVVANNSVCRLYRSNFNSYCDSNISEFIRYFTDIDLPTIRSIYDFEEEDTEEDSSIYSFDMKNSIDFNAIAECAKNNKITKENKDMPPYKHHIINPGTLSLYFGDCSGVHRGTIQETKHITVKDIKFNGPATIIFYADGSKEVVKRQNNDKIDKEKAIYMAMLKHKNKKLFSIINKALSSEDPEKTLAYEFIKYEGGDAKLLHRLCNKFIKAEKPKKKTKKNNAKVATKKTNKKSKEDK